MRDCILDRENMVRFPHIIYTLQSNRCYKYFMILILITHLILAHWYPVTLSDLKKVLLYYDDENYI